MQGNAEMQGLKRRACETKEPVTPERGGDYAGAYKPPQQGVAGVRVVRHLRFASNPQWKAARAPK